MRFIPYGLNPAMLASFAYAWRWLAVHAHCTHFLRCRFSFAFRVAFIWWTFWMCTGPVWPYCSSCLWRRPACFGSTASKISPTTWNRCLASGPAYSGASAGNTLVPYFCWWFLYSRCWATRICWAKSTSIRSGASHWAGRWRCRQRCAFPFISFIRFWWRPAPSNT